MLARSLYTTLAATDLVGISGNTAHSLERIAGLLLIALCGVKTLHHVSAHKAGAVVVTLVLALVPAYFALLPTQAENTLKSTAASLTK
jgi:hypothetical protein